MQYVYNCIYIVYMLNFIKNNQGKILNLFFQNTDQEFYLREIARKLNKKPGYFQRDIKNLVKEGVLNDERRANLRYFKLNKKYLFYKEIKKIISKSFGIEFALKKLIDKFSNIELSFIFGSIAKNFEHSTSDIDLILIGNINQDLLIKNINKLEKELNREINYIIYDKKEFIEKIKKKNDFIIKILQEPKIILKGKLSDY